MSTNDLRPMFVRGHRIDGRVYEFPHICPGRDCAVATWLQRCHDQSDRSDVPVPEDRQ